MWWSGGAMRVLVQLLMSWTRARPAGFSCQSELLRSYKPSGLVWLDCEASRRVVLSTTYFGAASSRTRT